MRCCLPGDQKLVAKGGRAASWCCNQRRRGYSFFSVARRASLPPHQSIRSSCPTGLTAVDAAPLDRTILITLLSRSSTAVPLSPRGASGPPAPLPPGRLLWPGHRRRSSRRRRCPLGAAAARRWAAANFEAGRCFLPLPVPPSPQNHH